MRMDDERLEGRGNVGSGKGLLIRFSRLNDRKSGNQVLTENPGLGAGNIGGPRRGDALLWVSGSP